MCGETIKRRAGAGFREVGIKGDGPRGGVGSGGAFLGVGEGGVNGGDRGRRLFPSPSPPAGERGGDLEGGGGCRDDDGRGGGSGGNLATPTRRAR